MEKCDLKDARTAIRNPQSVTVFESIELEKMKKEIEEIRGKQAELKSRDLLVHTMGTHMFETLEKDGFISVCGTNEGMYYIHNDGAIRKCVLDKHWNKLEYR